MFWIVWLVVMACSGGIVWVARNMPRHAFWTVIAYDSLLLIGGVAAIVMVCITIKNLRRRA